MFHLRKNRPGRTGDIGERRRTGTFRALAQTIVGTLVVGLTVAVSLTAAAPAQAVYAEGGDGLYKGSIDWFEWSDTPNQTIPAEGMTVTNTRTIAGQNLATTCTISEIAGVLGTYRPGQYGGDALDDLYNVGGTGNANQMIIGLSNRVGATLVSFDVACSATLDGVSIALQGLVFADAETSTAVQGEYIEAVPSEPATWRVIDRYRSAGCTTSTQAIVGANGSLRFAPNGFHCLSAGGGAGPMAVGFMEGATSARIAVKGGGVSAVALGVVLQADFGDAPASYGEAGALFEPTWSGGEVGVGTTPVSGTDFVLGTPDQPNTRLGATVDADSGYLASDDALGDDRDGNVPSDEDAIANPGTIAVTPGQTYTLPSVECTGPGYVAGWIDWNGNGTFDEGERSAAVECTGTAVDLTWTVPAGTKTGTSFLRLRIALNESDVASPTGMTTSGEVEDYQVAVQLPELAIEKTSTATAENRAGDTVTYTVTATNDGETAFTDTYPAVVFDDLSGVLDDATYNGDGAASVGSAPSYAQPLLSWTGPLAVGESVSLTYSATVTAGGDGTTRNIAWVPNDPETPTTPSCEVPNDGTDPVTGEPCAVALFELPKLTIAKTANRTELPGVGESVEYTIEVTNVGPGDYTAENPATFVDDLGEVLDDATFDGVATASVGTASFADPELRWEGVLVAGESATIAYKVTYTGEGDQSLVNVVCVPVTETAAGAESCARVTVPGARLTQWKSVQSSDSPAVAGSVLTYALHFGNDGSAAATVDAVDLLGHVLDDADVTAEPVASTGLTAVRDGETIAITGTVGPGAEATVVYEVTLKADGERGDDIAANYLLTNDPANPPTTPTAPVCTPVNADQPNCTVTPIAAVTYAKAVTASSDPIATGTELTYTITITGTGTATTPVSRDDVLADVLDDTTLTGVPTSDVASVTVGEITDGRFHIGGELAGGATATVTYRVTVNDASDRGNNIANNFLVPEGGTPPVECTTGSTDCTVTPLPAVSVTKSADPASGSEVAAGDEVTYTLTFVNTGEAIGGADYTDDLSAVLDDANLTGQPVSSDTALTGTFAASAIRVTGAIDAGATTTVSYTVTVRPDDAQGDRVLRNVVAITGTQPECDTTAQTCTEHPITPTPVTGGPTPTPAVMLAVTGGTLSPWILALILLLPLGAGLIALSRLRRTRDEQN